jgi:hypothetical protein
MEDLPKPVPTRRAEDVLEVKEIKKMRYEEAVERISLLCNSNKPTWFCQESERVREALALLDDYNKDIDVCWEPLEQIERLVVTHRRPKLHETTTFITASVISRCIHRFERFDHGKDNKGRLSFRFIGPVLFDDMAQVNYITDRVLDYMVNQLLYDGNIYLMPSASSS